MPLADVVGCDVLAEPVAEGPTVQLSGVSTMLERAQDAGGPRMTDEADEASGLSCKACKVQNTLRFFSHGNVNKFYLVKCMNPACTWEWTRRRT